MNKCLKNAVFHFADDTSFLCPGNSPSSIVRDLKKDMYSLYDWLCANKLSLNVDKTEFILFKPVKEKIPPVHLKFLGKKIRETKKVKYLGLVIDHRLKWKCHISELRTKLGRGIGILGKLKNGSFRLNLCYRYTTQFSYVICCMELVHGVSPPRKIKK